MKVGLFFGSFNPIHIGHLILANYMAEFTPLDQVWFIVSPHNPLKAKSSLLADHHRLALVKLAIEESDYLKASDIEFKLSQPSYTINTLTYLKEKHPNLDFTLIMGADNLETIHKWKNYEMLLNNYPLFIYPRPGYSGGEKAKHPNVFLQDAPLIEISSTFIRQAIKSKKNIRYWIPDKVLDYIQEMHFYKK
jgi:nicotinate-nucleotide adenylyltransferase